MRQFSSPFSAFHYSNTAPQHTSLLSQTPQYLHRLKILRRNIEYSRRWRRSKTWRSPSSPQIHQKYNYMWNNSYRTPTECLQKTSDFPKGKKLPTYLGRVKEKRKNRDKRIGTGPALLGGSCEGGSFHTLGSPFVGRDGWWQRGEASEPRRRAQQQWCGGQSREIPAQRMGADQHSTA